MAATNVLIYIVRHDLRVTDNPVLHHLASTTDHDFTHLIPVYIIPPNQLEISGFLEDGKRSPYPEARSEIAHFWRCGPHRARFMAQSIWNMKENLEKLRSGLIIRIGPPAEALRDLIDGLKQNDKKVGAVWSIQEEGYEEARDEKSIAEVCSSLDIDHKLWVDEKYFIDDRDLKLDSPKDLPDVFTTYRKMNEPLRERPRSTRPRPSNGSLPDLVESAHIPDQPGPFKIPSSAEAFEAALLRPIEHALPEAAPIEEGKSSHPFRGGEDNALKRLDHIIKTGVASLYKSSRNGLVGVDYSTKLSAYLAQGCITARMIHEELLKFEDGTDQTFVEGNGFGQGENEGTKAIRLELLWRDYMRLCTRKFRLTLFLQSGFRQDYSHNWKSGGVADKGAIDESRFPEGVSEVVRRVFAGTTGQSLIDASSRELIHTGYTSNRARQNVGNFLAKHLNIDWRYGAEWYEFMLVDYDVNSNWANWQYVAGVGNDPRGEARIFNPVKQAFDYDKDGDYVRCWIPELRKIEKLENLFQPWTTPREDWERYGLVGVTMAEDPVKKIDFSVEGKPKSARRPFVRRRGRGRGESNAVQPSVATTPPSQASDRSEEQQVSAPTPSRSFPGRDAIPPSRGNLRGNGRGNSRGNSRGGSRGRGFGGPRRGFQGARGGSGWQQPYDPGHGSIPPHPWAQISPT